MKSGFFRKVSALYIEGFRFMPLWGKQVWIIIIIKLFVMFAILRLFFFPDFLKVNFDSDDARSEYVIDQVTNKP
jgi:hypothetical protein